MHLKPISIVFCSLSSHNPCPSLFSLPRIHELVPRGKNHVLVLHKLTTSPSPANPLLPKPRRPPNHPANLRTLPTGFIPLVPTPLPSRPPSTLAANLPLRPQHLPLHPTHRPSAPRTPELAPLAHPQALPRLPRRPRRSRRDPTREQAEETRAPERAAEIPGSKRREEPASLNKRR